MVAWWLHPRNMTCVVHEFDLHEGGRFRISLVYLNSTARPGGKTTENTDTSHGRFARLIPNERVVQVVEFES
jgi:uncharacterized protein YndB with AHSA1/START domain